MARSAAIDLAEGLGLLGPEPDSHCFYDKEEWEGVERCHGDDRRRPVIWMPTHLICIHPPDDGYAAYGRPFGWDSVPYCFDIDEAMREYGAKWRC